MRFRLSARYLFLCLLAGAYLPAVGQTLYRWVDKDGVVHYGDSIPPEYATQDRDLLNSQGITVGSEQGEITPEERAEMDRIAAAEAAERDALMRQAQRDRMLLNTYLSVADIEDLRDRRLELIDSRIRVTEVYLSNLRNRLASLERDRGRYSPLSERKDAPPVPEDLVLDISRIEASIRLYEQTLNTTRDDRNQLYDAFALDIERFRELKGG